LLNKINEAIFIYLYYLNLYARQNLNHSYFIIESFFPILRLLSKGIMKKLIILSCSLLLYSNSVYTQHNMLGKSQKYIRSFYNLSLEYTLKVDTITPNSLMLSYKTEKQYPFYTYEISLEDDICISYGIVSKDNATLKTYLEFLNYVGELIEVDSTYNNFTYKIETNQKTSFFTIKQPYFNSQFLTRRSLFYILITEEQNSLFEKKNLHN